MKQLNTSLAGVFGPLSSIARQGDGWLCDGCSYQDSVVGDATVEDYVAPPQIPVAPLVPQKITRRQAKQALALAGLLSLVQPAIDAIPDPTQRTLFQIEWDDSQEFERHRPALLVLAGALGLTSEHLDNLFIQGASL